MRNDFESNYLAHWGIAKGGKAANHKYFERIERAGKYIYFYTQAEYERWLHGSKKALDTAKGKAKGASQKLNNLRTRKMNVRQATTYGSQMTPQLVARSRTTLTKSNVGQIISRGQSTISSILSRTKTATSSAQRVARDTVSKAQSTYKNTVSKVKDTASKAQRQAKDTSSKAMDVAKSLSKQIQSNAKSTVSKAQKTVENYAAKGQKTLNSIMNKAKSISVDDAVKKFASAGQQILAPVLVAANNVKNKVVNKITEKKRRQEEIEKARKEGELRKKEIEARNEARKIERQRASTKPKDANDSYVEDLAAHTDIRQKNEELSKDEDMKVINQMYNIPPEEFKKQKQLNAEAQKAWNQYLKTGNEEDYKKYLEAYNKYADIYGKYYGYLNNCANCTLTYDLRRRGYDVDAPWNNEGTKLSSIFDWYKMSDRDIDSWDSDEGDYKAFSRQEAKEIVNDIKEKYPEGAYGHFLVQWQHPGSEESAGGHDCVWSIENDKVIIRDCQTNEIIDPERYLTNSYSVSYFRADDKELNDKVYDLAKADIANSNGDNVTTDKYYQDAKQKIQANGKQSKNMVNRKKGKVGK